MLKAARAEGFKLTGDLTLALLWRLLTAQSVIQAKVVEWRSWIKLQVLGLHSSHLCPGLANPSVQRQINPQARMHGYLFEHVRRGKQASCGLLRTGAPSRIKTVA